ncbi:glycoside hydrolase family 1 protein [Thermophilibacter immobilis]|uniref:Glycoside hydrolase family 1 protein n=1 Tax=Thermophilibacter immobilis TaxID=2779519 RepID=A0A7S7M8R7_9ACTN|nr:glycoside hydrolase family 1 protein [Thermophilibacter immobilis]QOY60547.1 glycoside hydrolase family 1 protein [Thermophilibacter immobilis]
MRFTSREFEGRPFIWGSANSAYQCEGAWDADGRGLGEWDYFNAQPHMNTNHVDATQTSDFYHRYREDIDLMAQGGQNSVRLSLSWSRIIPQGTGEVNEQGVSFYNDLIDYCVERGVEPNLTLLQYDLPYAMALTGGWSNSATADAFCAYACVCFERFGDRVCLWSTVDEPQYYSYCANFLGIYPPCRHVDIQSYLQWQYNQMLGSAKAIKAFHGGGYEGAIGVIHQDCNVELAPGTRGREGVYAAADFFYNRLILCPALEGRIPPETNAMLEKLGTYLYRVPNEEEIFSDGIVDFLSLNVFCRKYVTDWQGGAMQASGNIKGADSSSVEGQVVAPLFETAYDAGETHNQWGRELLPRVMYSSLMRVKEQYGNPPVVAENGHGSYETPDARGFVEDDGRISVIGEFLDHLEKAKREGANVRGYYYWSTMDLYSWVNGYEKRYGLVRVDFDNGLKRIPKKSWGWYRDLIRQPKS